MIASFKKKALSSLWRTGRSKIDSRLFTRILRRLDALNVAAKPEEMDIPAFDFHSLMGLDPTRYTVHVNGAWFLTFALAYGDD